MADGETKPASSRVILFDKPPTKEEYDLAEFYLDPFVSEILHVYEIVRNYIIDNKLILVGGMAVNYALRGKGSYLYRCEEVDYDFYSSNFVKDSYALANIIGKSFKHIQCINALHRGTMRVRHRYEPVADISQFPKSLYDNIPYLLYRGIRFVHPCWQLIDMHLAFGLPWHLFPTENIYSRWDKDIERYAELNHYYDIPAELAKIVNLGAKSRYKTIEINLADYEGQCLSGYVAASYWCGVFEGVTGSGVGVVAGGKLSVSVPEDTVITVLSTNINEYTKPTTDIKYFNRLIGVIPQRCECTINDTNLNVIDTYGFLVSAKKIPDTNVYIAGANYVMAHLSTLAQLFLDQQAAHAYIDLNKIMLDIVNSEDDSRLAELIPITYYGTVNLCLEDALDIEELCADIKGIDEYQNEMYPLEYDSDEVSEFPHDYKFDTEKYYNDDSSQCAEQILPFKPKICEGVDANIYEPNPHKSLFYTSVADK